MTITINGKLAALKEKTSFEFISENRDFSGADSYSMTITFPLKDCPQNTAIFGHINRKDVEKHDMLLECEIRDKAFLKRGSIAINQIDDIEVKTQFLEGRSANNYVSGFDNVYINQLDLGYPDTDPATHPVNLNPWDTRKYQYTALPWVNNSSGNIQNNLTLQPTGGAQWNCSQLSFQPFMKYLVRLIFDKLGYTYNLDAWEGSMYRDLLCCNTLPAAWNVHNWAKALPHWTLTEFLEQLELLMNCEFNVDHAARHVTFVFTREAIQNCGTVELTQVLDDYEVENQDVGDCKYRGAVNLKYADCDHRMWKYYVNPTFIDYFKSHSNLYREYDYAWQLAQKAREGEWYESYSLNGLRSYLFYCKSENRYVINRMVQFVQTSEFNFDGNMCPQGFWYTAPQVVNAFGPRIVDPDAETRELKIVPAWIDDTEPNKGQVFFLQLPDYANEKGARPFNGFSDWYEAMANMGPEADYTLRTVEMDSGDEEEYIDKIYVGFWLAGRIDNVYRHPYIDKLEFEPIWMNTSVAVSLSLNSDTYGHYCEPEKIIPTQKFTFKFLSDNVPNPRSVFIIYGKRYVCEKITATFTEKGMSQLMKGVFYQVRDED